ncbi:hypothetical protein SDC9_149609 [bioreactor metagenome]|uniref:Uncharacterized protein n=1 Tax=bioreactor metagenome TaxID=1076179 RepID=A0A645EPC4_9ZZZZ
MEMSAVIEFLPGFDFPQKFSGFLSFVIDIIVISLEKTVSFVLLKQVSDQLFFYGSKGMESTKNKFSMRFICEMLNLALCRFVYHSRCG